MSDKIIDFNDLKNKAKETDVDKFEKYIYDLYYSVMDGSMSMIKFSSKIMEYMKENNISHEKFINIQKKFMERYGFSGDEIEKELKKFGIDSQINNIKVSDLDDITEEDFNSIKKSASFFEKYKENLSSTATINIKIKNSINDINIVLEKENVVIYSHKKIDLKDYELNDFILSYKKMLNTQLKVTLCENCIKYTY